MRIRIFVNPELLARELRKDGMTQARLAVALGVSQALVSMWMSQQRAMGPVTAQRLQRALRARWDDVFGRVESGTGTCA